MLRGLKMFGMAQAVGDLNVQGATAFNAAVPIIAQLLNGRDGERRVRFHHLPDQGRTLPRLQGSGGFDFASSEVIDETTVRLLHAGAFIDGADNIVLIGGPGTGKTHIASALGIQAVRASPQEGAVLLDR